MRAMVALYVTSYLGSLVYIYGSIIVLRWAYGALYVLSLEGSSEYLEFDDNLALRGAIGSLEVSSYCSSSG